MMLEIFSYTERVVNMVRPRKLLFMAIGESLSTPQKREANRHQTVSPREPR